MKEIKKYFHLFMMGSEFILAAIAFTLFIYGIKLINNKYEIIWTLSKIATIKQLIIDNRENIFPLNTLDVFEDNITANYSSYNYEYLLNLSTSGNCETNFKKCGTLDNLNKSLCIPEDGICPINKIIIDFTNKSEEYIKNGYYNSSRTIVGNKSLYYKNNENENQIIVKVYMSYVGTQFINENNFILTNDTHVDEKFEEYKNNRFTEDDNKDEYYKEIINTTNLKIYAKNFIGFDSVEDMENIINNSDELSNLYKIEFPNLAYTILGFIFFLVLIIMFFFSLIKFFSDENIQEKYKKNYELLTRLVIGGIYLIIFILFFIYLILACIKLFSSNVCSKLKKVNADDNIKNYIKDVCKSIKKKRNLNISSIVFFVVSLICFIIGWSLESLYILHLRLKGKTLELQWIKLKKKFHF